MADLHVVVPAGGAGTRLWPLSRVANPKFLLDLTGAGRSLIQQTWDRLTPLAQGILVVTGAPHAAAVTQQLPGLPLQNLLVEPAPRSSMPAIGLAAALLQHRLGDVVLGSFAADHIIRDRAGFSEAVQAAHQAAQAGYLATIGIEPTSPATAYGYIQAGPPLGLAGAPQVHQVARFVEKPDLATAQEYLAQGNYRWNAGMFLVRTGVLLDHLARLHPATHQALTELAAAWDTDQRAAAIQALWPQTTKISIDHAIAEPVAAEGGVATVAGRFDWVDVGDFAALAALHPEGRLRLCAEPGPVALDGAPGCLVVQGTERAIAVVGLADVVVVDTPGGLLVTRLDQAQRVKDVTSQLRDQGFADYL